MSSDRKLDEALLEAHQRGVERLIAAAIFICANRALVLRRLTTDNELPGFWELPGGHVEPGESVLQGLHREIDEETGIAFGAEPKLTSWFDYRNSKGTLSRQLNFLVELPHELAPPHHPEHDAFQWLDAAHIQTLNCSPETRRSILDALLKT